MLFSNSVIFTEFIVKIMREKFNWKYLVKALLSNRAVVI